MGNERVGPPARPPAPATRVRFGVLAYLCVLTFILYLDRYCMGQAAPAIQREMGLDNTKMGIVHGAFTLAYGLFMAVAGMLGDRRGSRGVLVGIVLWWSAFTALTGLATGLVMLVVIRFVFGAGEAGALPNCARIVARWFPVESRGFPQGMVNTAALAGGALAPVTAAYVIALLDERLAALYPGRRPEGWRYTFFFFGTLGVVWAAAFWWWYRDDPAQHPGVNESERAFILRGRTDAGPAPPVPWGRVFASRNVWLLGFIMTCATFISYLPMSWYTTYLQSARGVGPLESGRLASLVMVGGALGSVLGGLLGDRVFRRTQNRRNRCRIGSASMAVAAAGWLASLSCDSAEAAAWVTGAGYLAMMLMIASWWGVVADISGPHVGALFGLMNSMGIVGGITSQVFFGWFGDFRASMGFHGRSQWDPAFYAYVAALLAGSVAWLFVNPRRSAVE